MKAKGTGLIAVLLIVSMLLAGCSPLVEDIPQSTTVYATFYPIYALAAAVSENAENLEVHCLVQPQDGCLRSYEVSDWDLYMMAYSANAILSAGNGLESFSERLESLAETTLPLAEVMYGLELYQMNEAGDEGSHFAGTNPHLYMSVAGAEAIVENIAGSMTVFDESNEELYEKNLEQIREKLRKMKDIINEATEVCANVRAAVLNETLFYSATDCGLEIVGYYERESSEMLYGDGLENCLNALVEMNAQVVLIERQAPAELVEAIEAAGFAVAKLDTMSTLSEADGAAGYFETLESNAIAVAEACSSIQE